MIGAGLIVAAAAAGWPLAIKIIGVALLIFAVSLAILALLFVLRLRMVVVTGPEELTVLRGRQTRAVAWSMIDTVKLNGQRLTVVTRPEAAPSLEVINPRTASDPTFLALISTVQRRLDADRGYRPIT